MGTLKRSNARKPLAHNPVTLASSTLRQDGTQYVTLRINAPDNATTGAHVYYHLDLTEEEARRLAKDMVHSLSVLK